MANFIYPKAKEGLFAGVFTLTTKPLKALLIDSSFYSFNLNTDTFLSDIPSNAIRKTSDPITGVTSTLGVIDADDLIISDHDGSAFDVVILYQSESLSTTSRLLAYIDTALGLPFTGASSTVPVTIMWNNGSNKIISI